MVVAAVALSGGLAAKMIKNKLRQKMYLIALISIALLLSGCPAKNDKIYPVTEEEYLIGWVLHNIGDSTPTDIAYSENELAVYNYSFNYPAHGSSAFDNVEYWISPIQIFTSSSFIRFGAPQNRLYYLKGDNLSPSGNKDNPVYSHDWSFYSHMNVNYLTSRNPTEQFAYNLMHSEHFNSERPFKAIKPIPGKKEHVYFGTSPFTPASIVVNPSKNEAPIGWLDEVTSEGIARGWALDPNWPGNSIDVHLYFDKPAGSGTAIGIRANFPRPNVNEVEHVAGDHGFEFVVPQDYRDGKEHQIYVYGIDLDDSSGNSNRQLNGVPKKFTLQPTSSLPIVNQPATNNSRPRFYTIELNDRLLKGYTGKSYLKRETTFQLWEMSEQGFRLVTVTIPPPAFKVYLNGKLVREGNLVDENGIWDHSSLLTHLKENGNYRVVAVIPSGYPTFDNTTIETNFNFQNKPLELPVLKHIEFPPRFAVNEKLPISVEFENDNSVSKVELYYKTDSMSEWTLLGNSKQAVLTITEPKAKKINFRFVAYTADGSSSYDISPISLKSQDIFCQHIVDKINEKFILRGRCFDKKADSVPRNKD